MEQILGKPPPFFKEGIVYLPNRLCSTFGCVEGWTNQEGADVGCLVARSRNIRICYKNGYCNGNCSGKGEWSPVSKHQIQPECGEWAGCRETKLSGANGDRVNFVFPVQLTTSRIGNHTRLMPSLLKVMTTHTYTLLILILWLWVLPKAGPKHTTQICLCRISKGFTEGHQGKVK